MSKRIVAEIQQTIARIKAMEAGMYLTYTFADMPDGVFFMYQKDLLQLAERYEAYEAALLAIYSADNHDHIKTTAAAVLDEALNREEPDNEDIEDIEEFHDLWDLTENDDVASEVLLEINNDDLF